MLLANILAALEEIAPLRKAESWDNVGLIAGDPLQNIERIMLTIDYTKAVADKARDLNCDFVIAYHPPIFSAIKRITADGPGDLIHDAIRRGVAIYSPHTAWDVSAGGTNDFLADCLGLIDVVPLRLNSSAPTHLKLVTFVPEANVDAVSDAVFSAGAGHIGKYHSCSFRTPGFGTFFGEAGTHPTVGQAVQLEKQPEIRLETVVPVSKVDAIVAALLASHPYEEPAYDLTVLASAPSGVGQGRVGSLPAPMGFDEVVERIKKELGLSALLTAGETKSIQRVAICAGAGGELLDAAIANKADLFLTGELRHHDALKAVSAGMNVMCTLHSNCERPSLTRLKARLELLLGGLAEPAGRPQILLSQRDRDPFLIR